MFASHKSHFSVTFENGINVSVSWLNYRKFNANDNQSLVAEIVVFNNNTDTVVTQPDGQTYNGYRTTKELVEIMNWAEKL